MVYRVRPRLAITGGASLNAGVGPPTVFAAPQQRPIRQPRLAHPTSLVGRTFDRRNRHACHHRRRDGYIVGRRGTTHAVRHCACRWAGHRHVCIEVQARVLPCAPRRRRQGRTDWRGVMWEPCGRIAHRTRAAAPQTRRALHRLAPAHRRHRSRPSAAARPHRPAVRTCGGGGGRAHA